MADANLRFPPPSQENAPEWGIKIFNRKPLAAPESKSRHGGGKWRFFEEFAGNGVQNGKIHLFGENPCNFHKMIYNVG